MEESSETSSNENQDLDGSYLAYLKNRTDKENPDTDKSLEFTPAQNFWFGRDCSSEKLTSDYFSGSSTPSKLRESTRRLSEGKSFNSYIAYSSDEELEDWWEQAKTDYTYSASLSYRERVTPDRSIISPNMSRRGLRAPYGSVQKSPPFTRVDLPANSGDRLYLRSRSIPRTELGAFSDESDVDESQYKKTSHYSYIVKKSSSSWSQSANSHQKHKNHSNGLEYGLDEGSDSEYESSASPQFARPIVRKGTASLFDSLRSHSVKNGKYVGGSVDGESKMGNHVVPGRLESSNVVGSNGRLGHYLHRSEWSKSLHDRRWKDIILERSSVTWKRITTLTSIILVHSITWITSPYMYAKDYLTNYTTSQSQSTKATDFTNTHRNVFSSALTTTRITVVKKWRVVSTYTGHILSWYEKNRKRSPFIWGWLPLLLLLLIPILFYQFEEEKLQSEAKSPVERESLMSLAYKGLYFIVSHLTNWILTTGYALRGALIYSWETTKYLTISVTELCVSGLIWLMQLLSQFSSAVFTYLFSFPSPHEQEPKDDDSGWAKGFSFSTVIANGYSSVSRGASYVGEHVWFGVIYVGALAWSGVHAVWSYISAASFMVWQLLVYILSSILVLLEHIYAAGTSGISAVAKIPYQIFMLIPSLNSSSKEDSSGIRAPVSIEPPVLKTTSEEATERILDDSRIRKLISVSFQEHIDNSEIYKERLSRVVRESVETEFFKLSAETPKKSDVMSLKSQQEELLSQFDQLRVKLELMITEREKGKETSKSVEDLKASLAQVSDRIDSLSKQIDVLRTEQSSLKENIKSCCSNVPLSVEKVKEHVVVLLSDLLQSDFSEGGEGGSFEEFLSKIELRMKNYFATKEEMENKVAESLVTVQNNVKNDITSNNGAYEETLRQSNEQLMNTVLDMMRKEVRELEEKSVGKKMEEVEKKMREYEDEQRRANDDLKLSTEAKMDEMKMVFERKMLSSINASLDDLVKSLLLKGESGSTVTGAASEIKSFIAHSVDRRMQGDEVRVLLSQKVSEIFEENLMASKINLELAKERGNIMVETNGTTLNGLNASDVERIVKAALLKYDADKTGMVDHALESGGGSIVSTRCTEGYEGHQAELTMFGYSIYRYSTNTPRSIIQPDRNPGQCYAFKGSQGYIVIQFAGPVRATAFTMEHIPKSLTPSGSIDSAPREFSVYGLNSPDEEGFHFGDFVYDEGGEPLQYFPVQNLSDDYYKYVELKILSNHGHMQYTCLYRFRVHGVRELL